MAGKRQHYVPLFLQRGFVSHAIGDEEFTWVYRKDTKVFNTNIKNAGVEGFFYSEDGEAELDERITDAESIFALCVNRLRVEDGTKNIDPDLIAQLLSHLEVRTRHLRQSFLSVGNHLVTAWLEFLSDPVSFENFFRRRIVNDPSIIEESLSKELDKRGISKELLPIYMQLSEPLIEQFMPEIINQMTRGAAYLKEIMPEKLKEASKTGHLKALTKTITPDVKIQRYRALNYRVETTEGNSLPLGDSAVLFNVIGERAFKPFLDKDDGLKAVILPICPKKILVGCAEDYMVDFSALPRAISACSLEYFIACDDSPENQDLQTYISENAHLLTHSEIGRLIDDFANE